MNKAQILVFSTFHPKYLDSKNVTAAWFCDQICIYKLKNLYEMMSIIYAAKEIKMFLKYDIVLDSQKGSENNFIKSMDIKYVE